MGQTSLRKPEPRRGKVQEETAQEQKSGGFSGGREDLSQQTTEKEKKGSNPTPKRVSPVIRGN